MSSATSVIPIVFTISGDPVEAGLVQSIVFSTGQLDAKRLDLMSDIASLFGVLVNPKYPPAINQARELETAATKIGRAIFIAEASDDTKLEAAFVALLQKHIGALVVASDPLFDSRRARIIAFATEKRLPASVLWSLGQTGALVCRPAVTAVPDTLPGGPGHAGPRACVRGLPRSPSTSADLHPARHSP
jgi:ABC-type uncharacterized transport system substrate-binding protein